MGVNRFSRPGTCNPFQDSKGFEKVFQESLGAFKMSTKKGFGGVTGVFEGAAKVLECAS